MCIFSVLVINQSCTISLFIVEDIVTKGPAGIHSNPSSTSSPVSSSYTSSSSSIATTPPSHLTSPQTDTDGSLTSPSSNRNVFGSIPQSSSAALPQLPKGFDEHGKRVQTNKQTTQGQLDSQTTPTTSDIDPESGPLPDLPPGFGLDGRRKDSLSGILSSPGDIHPDLGPIPPTKPPTITIQTQLSLQDDTLNPQSIPLRSQTVPTSEDRHLIESLRQRIKELEYECEEYEKETHDLLGQKAELVDENKKLKSRCGQLESYISTLQSSPGKGSVSTQGKVMGGFGRMVTTPGVGIPFSSHMGFNRLHSPNMTNSSMNHHGMMDAFHKRHTEPVLNVKDSRSTHYANHHRPSLQTDSHFLSVSSSTGLARPNNLPLRMPNGGVSPNSPRSDLYWEQSPSYDRQKHGSFQRLSPGSDSSRDGALNNRLSNSKVSSTDDLTSGEDRSSIRSFGSGNSGKLNFTLSNTSSDQGTVV